ncbi:MAG: LppM family (lipo)protein [bacterium]
MRKLILLAMSSLSVLLLLVSCINYEQETTFNADGSGYAKIHYWMSTGADTGEIKAPVDQKEIEKYNEKKGIKVSDIKIEEKEGYTHVYYTLNFDNFASFLETDVGGFDKAASYFKEEGGKLQFLGTIRGSGTSGQPMDDTTKSMLSGYKFTYLFHFPGKIAETNGKLDEKDPKTVKWEYSLAEISSAPKLEMKAVVEKPAFAFNLTLIIIIVVVVIIIIIIIVILLVAKGKKKPPA